MATLLHGFAHIGPCPIFIHFHPLMPNLGPRLRTEKRTNLGLLENDLPFIPRGGFGPIMTVVACFVLDEMDRHATIPLDNLRFAYPANRLMRCQSATPARLGFGTHDDLPGAPHMGLRCPADEPESLGGCTPDASVSPSVATPHFLLWRHINGDQQSTVRRKGDNYGMVLQGFLDHQRQHGHAVRDGF